jgi:hypothetical protein
MPTVLHRILWIFLVIFGLTATLTISGLVYLWFINPKADMPYLRWLLSIVIAEVVGTIILFAKQGFRYIPDVRKDKNRAETSKFMGDFISHGSSVTIVSNRLAWLIEATEVQAEMIALARKGTRFEILTAQPVETSLRNKLRQAGVRFFVVNDEGIPEARFTLINADRSGAEKLAIARGTHPNHEITIFDSSSGPQIIGLAKDIVRKSKRTAVENGD